MIKVIVIVISLLLAEKIIMTVNTRFGQYWQMTIKIWQLVGHKILFTITRTEVFIGSLYTLDVQAELYYLICEMVNINFELTIQYCNCVSMYEICNVIHPTKFFLSRNKADKA